MRRKEVRLLLCVLLLILCVFPISAESPDTVTLSNSMELRTEKAIYHPGDEIKAELVLNGDVALEFQAMSVRIGYDSSALEVENVDFKVQATVTLSSENYSTEPDCYYVAWANEKNMSVAPNTVMAELRIRIKADAAEQNYALSLSCNDGTSNQPKFYRKADGGYGKEYLSMDFTGTSIQVENLFEVIQTQPGRYQVNMTGDKATDYLCVAAYDRATGRMKAVQLQSAENKSFTLSGVAAGDTVKCFWMDKDYIPRSAPVAITAN